MNENKNWYQTYVVSLPSWSCTHEVQKHTQPHSDTNTIKQSVARSLIAIHTSTTFFICRQ